MEPAPLLGALAGIAARSRTLLPLLGDRDATLLDM
jgi:hypothetical protein